MADILARFHFMNEKGAELGYFYSREAAQHFLPPADSYFNIQTIKIGDQLKIEDHLMEVTNIKINLHAEREGMLTDVGAQIYNADSITPYDITITVYFKRI